MSAFPNREVIGGMTPITLSEMDSIRLMNRVDTKYLTDDRTLERVLELAARSGYFIFENNGARILEYRSMYYDTPDLRMYMDHHNRHLVRQKLRTRLYVDTDTVFLELKSKNNHGRTKKKRLEISADRYLVPELVDGPEMAWLSERFNYPCEGLKPSLETLFSRITLVDSALTERSTIDLGLNFRNMRNGVCAGTGQAVIIEVKQDGNRPGPLREILSECRVKPVRVSKYCIGTAMTDAAVKSGRFKTKLMLIDKINDLSFASCPETLKNNKQ